MEPVRQLAEVVTALETTVDWIQGMQMHDPTPCSEFNVHDVLNHVMVRHGTFTYMFRGEDPPHLTPPPVYGWVPAEELREVMDDLLDAVNAPGALERTIEGSLGEVSGDTLARFAALDGLLHCWDLATATGVSYDVPETVVEAVDEFARTAITSEMRTNGMFAAPVAAPPDATALDRLAAFSGRCV